MDLCGDCFEKCQYMDLAGEESVREVEKLIEGKRTPVRLAFGKELPAGGAGGRKF